MEHREVTEFEGWGFCTEEVLKTEIDATKAAHEADGWQPTQVVPLKTDRTKVLLHFRKKLPIS